VQPSGCHLMGRRRYTPVDHFRVGDQQDTIRKQYAANRGNGDRFAYISMGSSGSAAVERYVRQPRFDLINRTAFLVPASPPPGR
jgi:hypothetical protein